MITKEIQELLNKQINAELRSALLYLSMSVNARHKEMCGVAHWLYIQAREELDHSRILQNYLIAQGIKIKLTGIEPVEEEWDSTCHIFEEALKQEKKVTEMINNIVQTAQKQNDYATLNVLTWFIDEQVEEEEQCSKLIKLFGAAKQNPCLEYQLNQELLRRKYEIPKHTHAEHWIS